MIAERVRLTARAAIVLSLCLACSAEAVEGSSTAGGAGTGASNAGGAAGSGGAPSAAGSAGTGGAGVSTGGTAGSSAGTTGSSGAAQGGESMGGASAGTGGAGGGTTLEPCADPAVSRLKVWEMQVVGGTQVPASGSPLRKYDGGGYEMYVEWTLTDGGSYGTANAPLNNMGQYTNNADPAKNGVDISKGPSLTIEYSSTGSTYMQIRTGAVPHGGDHFRADLPSTEGQMKTITLPLDSFRRPGGTTPPGNDVLKDAFSFTFVGAGSTKLAVRQVLIPGFIPPCQ